MAENKTAEQQADTRERAILVAVVRDNQEPRQAEEFLDELEFLAETAGIVTVRRFTQRLPQPSSKIYVGPGKLEEIASYCEENGISGRVLLSFVIEKDGSLTNIQVLQTPDRSLSDEATRVLKSSPKWTPGKQRNQSVRVKYTLPVDFRIQN